MRFPLGSLPRVAWCRSLFPCFRYKHTAVSKTPKKAVAAQRLFLSKCRCCAPFFLCPLGLLSAPNLHGALGAILCLGVIGLDRFSTDYTAFFCLALRLGIQNGGFQFWVLGQYGVSEPLAVQGIGNPLGADAAEPQVQSQTVSTIVVTAAGSDQLPNPLVLFFIHSGQGI